LGSATVAKPPKNLNIIGLIRKTVLWNSRCWNIWLIDKP